MFFLRIGPAIYSTVSGGRIDNEGIVQDIVSRKDIHAKDIKVAGNQEEWEKVFKPNNLKTIFQSK